MRWVRQMAKTGTPRPSDEVIAAPDHTLESLSRFHPAERRTVLARSEAACFSNPVAADSAARAAKGRYQPSPWLRGLVASVGGLQMGGSLTSIKVAPIGEVDAE